MKNKKTQTSLKTKFKKSPRADKLIYTLAAAELGIFLLGIPWLFTNSLAAILATFTWMALVPMVIITSAASLYVIRKIDKANSLIRFIIVLNWLALAFLISNVID